MTSHASALKYPVKRVFEEADERDLKLTKTAVNKVLYIVKQELGEENKFYDDILCFWYLHGTLALGAHRTLADLREDGYIGQDGNLYVNRTDVETDNQENNDEDEEELIEAINYALDEYDVYSEDRIRKLYEKYAPYEFMITFRHDILSKVEKLSEENSQTIFIPWSDSLPEEREELRDLLLKAESELPMGDEFHDFNDIFSRYVGASNYFLDTEPSREEFNFYYTITEQIWALFACKIRLVEHDEEIDVEEQGWIQDYEEQLAETKTYVKMLENTIREYDSDEVDSGSELWNKIAQTVR